MMSTLREFGVEVILHLQHSGCFEFLAGLFARATSDLATDHQVLPSLSDPNNVRRTMNEALNKYV